MSTDNSQHESDRERIIPDSPPAADGGASETKDPAAVALGRRGGLIGGRARANALSPERRREIARSAAQTRWANATSEKS
jgi:hypothetical protein